MRPMTKLWAVVLWSGTIPPGKSVLRPMAKLWVVILWSGTIPSGKSVLSPVMHMDALEFQIKLYLLLACGQLLEYCKIPSHALREASK